MSKKKTADLPADPAPVQSTDAPARALVAVTALVSAVISAVVNKLGSSAAALRYDVLISYPTSRPVGRFAVAEDDDAAFKAGRPYQIIHPSGHAGDAAALPELARMADTQRAKWSIGTKTLALVTRAKLLISPSIITDPHAVAGSAARAVLDLMAPPEARKGGGITTKTANRARVAETLGYNSKTDSFTALVSNAIKTATDAHLAQLGGMDAWKRETEAAFEVVNITTPPTVYYVQLACAGDAARLAAAKAAGQPKPNRHVYLSTPSGNAPAMLAAWRCPVPGCDEPLAEIPKRAKKPAKDTAESIKDDIKKLAADLEAAQPATAATA